MLAVVTGASGHVGAALVRALLAQGTAVRALYNSDRRALEGLACETARVNILDEPALTNVFSGAEVVYHFAGAVSIMGDPTGAVWKQNVEGTRCVVKAAQAAKCKRLVHCSSVGAFDLFSVKSVLHESAPKAMQPYNSAYDRSKAAGEAVVREGISNGLDAVVVNPTGVVGPFDFKPSRVGQVLLSLAKGKLPALVGGGADWVDVRDVAAGTIAAAANGNCGDNYLLGGHWTTIEQLARHASTVTNTPVPSVVPLGLAAIGAPFAEMFALATKSEPLYTRESLQILGSAMRVSTDRAKRVLGYVPRPLEETIRDAYEWFQQQGMVELRGAN